MASREEVSYCQHLHLALVLNRESIVIFILLFKSIVIFILKGHEFSSRWGGLENSFYEYFNFFVIYTLSK